MTDHWNNSRCTKLRWVYSTLADTNDIWLWLLRLCRAAVVAPHYLPVPRWRCSSTLSTLGLQSRRRIPILQNCYPPIFPALVHRDPAIVGSNISGLLALEIGLITTIEFVYFPIKSCCWYWVLLTRFSRIDEPLFNKWKKKKNKKKIKRKSYRIAQREEIKISLWKWSRENWI